MGDKVKSMKLFKVKGEEKNGYFLYDIVEYIVATTDAMATIKFCEMHPYSVNVKTKVLCLRDEIIPTVEPKKEFKNQ